MTRAWDMSRVGSLLKRLFTRPAVGRDPLAVAMATGAMSPNDARLLGAMREAWDNKKCVVVLPPHVKFTPMSEVIDAPPTPAEVEQAMGWLYGHRPARRKFERTRHHITYRQRDEVAHVLLRLSRAYEERNHE